MGGAGAASREGAGLPGRVRLALLPGPVPVPGRGLSGFLPGRRCCLPLGPPALLVRPSGGITSAMLFKTQIENPPHERNLQPGYPMQGPGASGAGFAPKPGATSTLDLIRPAL